MAATGLGVLVVAGVASAFMAWTIGAGSSGSTPFAPAVGANAISVLRAGFVVGVLGFFGAALQGANVSEAVGRGLVDGVALTPVAATIGLLIAAALVAFGVFTGYPIATAFTVTGAIVGAGLAIGGDPAWAKYQQIGALWLLTPLAGGGSAYVLAYVLLERGSTSWVVPALAGGVGAVFANIEFVALGPAGESRSIAAMGARGLPGPELLAVAAVSLGMALVWAVALHWQLRRDVALGQQRFLLVLGGLVAFSAGGSQVGLAIGPLLPLLDPYRLPLTIVLVGGGLGLLAGSWTGAPRMIKAISQDYSSLGTRRSIAALIPSFIIAQVAVFYGIPVSFNEIIVSAVIGGGAVGGGSVSREKVVKTAAAWVLSLGISFVAGYAALATITRFLL